MACSNDIPQLFCFLCHDTLFHFSSHIFGCMQRKLWLIKYSTFPGLSMSNPLTSLDNYVHSYVFAVHCHLLDYFLLVLFCFWETLYSTSITGEELCPFVTDFFWLQGLTHCVCSHSYVYWTDWTHKAYIGRVGMDGTNKSVVTSTKLEWPNGITIDYTNDLLYWTDAHLGYIEYVYRK